MSFKWIITIVCSYQVLVQTEKKTTYIAVGKLLFKIHKAC